jgi:hypothetical protein
MVNAASTSAAVLAMVKIDRHRGRPACKMDFVIERYTCSDTTVLTRIES